MFLELLDLAQEVKAAPAKARAAIAETAVALGLDVLPVIHANVRKGASGWEIVAAAVDPTLLPEPTEGAFRASARLDFSRVEVPPGGQKKDP